MKILFFTPYAATWDSTTAEAFIADALRIKGNEVTIVTCQGLMKSYCIAMAARNIRHEVSAEKKQQICLQCKSNMELINSRFHFDTRPIENFVSNEDYLFAKDFKSKITRENFLNIECDGHPVGRYGLYEVLIHNKKSSLNLSDSEWKQYIDAVENAVLSLKGAQKAFEKIKPDRFIVFGSLYSSNQVWKKEAQRQGITPYQIHGPAGTSDVGLKFTVMKDNAIKGVPYADAIQKWPKIAPKPVGAAGVKAITRHFKHVMSGGAYVYSPKTQGRNVRKFYGFDTKKPLFVATLSSQDEIIAAETCGYPPFDGEPAFPSQVEWIRQLLKYFLNKPEWQLLIRPHPRMYPTVNNKVISEEAQAINKLCQDLPFNIKVNAPKDGVSMYEVLQDADVILNAWSSVGVEAAVFGLPVIQYQSLSWFPDEINTIAHSPADYFQKIQEALSKKTDIEKIKKVYRWLGILYETSVLDLSHVFYLRGFTLRKKIIRRILHPSLFFEKNKAISTVFEKAELNSYKLRQEHIDLVNNVISGGQSSIIESRLGSSPSVSLEEEKAEIKKSIRYLLKLSSKKKKTPLTAAVEKAMEAW